MLTTEPPRISVFVVICPYSFASGVVSLVPSKSGESSYCVEDLGNGRDHFVLQCVREWEWHTFRRHPPDGRIE
jgi:hypothetical protein